MSTKNQRASNQARQALVDARVLAIEIDAALRGLEVGLAGWPERTPGAAPAESGPLTQCHVDGCEHWRPCPEHGDDVELTGPERAAVQGDKARVDLDRLLEHVRLAAHHTAAAVAVAHRWAWDAPDESMVQDALAAIDGDIWCEHCIRFGEHNPRETTRKLCTFCRSFKKDWKTLPSREIWAARNARGGRIDVATVERILSNAKRQAAADEAERDRADKRKERQGA
jgi:hypothetical protein